MKKTLLSALAVSSLMLGSCQMQDLETGRLSGEVDFSISAGIPKEITTYAGAVEAYSHQGGASNLSPADYTLRYVLQAFDKDGRVAYEEVKNAPDGTFNGVTFNVRLLAKSYDFVFWADFVKKSDASVIYNVGNENDGYRLDNITYTEGVTMQDLTSDEADAYTKTIEVDLSQASQTISEVKLQRPFGKIRLIATDILDQNNKQQERPGEVTINFNDAVIPSAFNALKQSVVEDATIPAGSVTFAAICEDAKVNTNVYEDSYLLGYSYIFASNGIPSYSMDVEVKGDLTLGVIGTRSLSAIPVQTNKLTTVIGNFYTNESSIEVVVEDAFDGEVEVPVEETISVGPDDNLQKIINEAENNSIILLEPGEYTGNYTLVAGKSLTFKGVNAGVNPNTRSTQAETIFTGSIGGNRLSTTEVLDMNITIDGIKFTGKGVKVGSSQYNAIGQLTIQNCVYESSAAGTTADYFVALSHNAKESCRSNVVRLTNNKIINLNANSYYSVRLWAVKNIEVTGNVFELAEGASNKHLHISSLSTAEDASIIINNNIFTNGLAGVNITSWHLGNAPWADNIFTGAIQVTGNTFNNVALTSMENPKMNNVPVFISPEYNNDNVSEGRANDHGLFYADITVDNNTYNGNLRDNFINNAPVYDQTANKPYESIQAAVDAAADGAVIVLAPGEYNEDVTLKPFFINNDNAGTITIKAKSEGTVLMKRTLFADRTKTDKVYPDLKVIVDGLSFKFEKMDGETIKDDIVSCIGNYQYNAIGELTVQNCSFEPNTSLKNYFIATNHAPNDICRSIIRLYNNKIGSKNIKCNVYPVRLWNVKEVEVVGNEFAATANTDGPHLYISKISGKEDASIVVKDNTFTNAKAGVSVTTWQVGEPSDYSNNKYTGTIEISGNTFNNVAPSGSLFGDEVPIYVGPKYKLDIIGGNKEADNGVIAASARVIIEDNAYPGYTPKDNVIKQENQ